MLRLLVLAAAVAAFAAGCGATRSSAPPATTTAQATPAPTTTAPGSGPNALQAEANATAAGDIPDNQVFLRFRNPGAGYAIKYPEGWAQQGSGNTVSFRDRNNIVRIEVAPGSPPTAARVRAEVAKLKERGAVQSMQISGRPAVKVVYSTVSAPNAVTGKRVTLVVDRYYLWHGGKRAVVDLGTPEGVDNVDAYRLMIESFRWS